MTCSANQWWRRRIHAMRFTTGAFWSSFKPCIPNLVGAQIRIRHYFSNRLLWQLFQNNRFLVPLAPASSACIFHLLKKAYTAFLAYAWKANEISADKAMDDVRGGSCFGTGERRRFGSPAEFCYPSPKYMSLITTLEMFLIRRICSTMSWLNWLLLCRVFFLMPFQNCDIRKQISST